MNEQHYQETSTEMRFASAVGIASTAWEVARQMVTMTTVASWDWIILYRAVAIGTFLGGVAYALTLVIIAIAPGLPALLLKEVEEATGKSLGKPTQQPQREPKRESQTMQQVAPVPFSYEALPLEDDDDEELEPLPQWIINTDKMVWADRLNIGGKVLDIPDGFNTRWLYTVAEKRYSGELETVSTRALHDVGIDRFDGSATAVLTLLESAELISRAGDRQPYTWTDAGQKLFPHPAQSVIS